MQSRSSLGEVDQLGRQVAVVEDVAVAERGSLGVAGGARRVLDVDRVVGLQGPHPLVHHVGVDVLARLDHGRPVAGADVDHPLEGRAVTCGLLDHRAVVAGLEALRRDQHPHARLVDGVGELVGAVGRVDVDEDRADLRRGVLRDRPLGAVGCPHTDAVALDDAARDQPPREQVDVVVELAVGPAPPGAELDERLMVRMSSHGAVEVVSDRLLEQRGFELALRVRLGHVPERTPGWLAVSRTGRVGLLGVLSVRAWQGAGATTL